MKPTLSTSPQLRLAQRALSTAFIGMILLMIPFGNKMNTAPVFGVLVCAVGLVIGSSMLYALLCLPLRNAHRLDPAFRTPFRLATAGVIISPFHVPLWVLLTREFPPDHFAPWTMWIVAPLLGLSLIGPLVPFFRLAHRAELERNRTKYELFK